MPDSAAVVQQELFVFLSIRSGDRLRACSGIKGVNDLYALAVTLGVFALVLIMARFKVPLAAALFAGAVILGPLFGLGFGCTVRAVLSGAIQPNTIALIVLTVLLLALSHTMQSAGQMERMVSLARAMLRRPAVAMAALPALIGLLPMPGGALFSAPMVRTASGDTRLPGGLLSAVNYWFRHIWEHWWPLYPGVILAMTLTQSRLDVFIVHQIPLGISMALAGLLIFRGAHPDLRAAGPPAEPGTKRKLLRATSSIWIILLAWGAAAAALKLIGSGAASSVAGSVLERYAPITLGLIVALIWTIAINGMGKSGLTKAFARRSPYDMAILVLSVMIFRHMLEATDAAPRIAAELTALRVPLVLVVTALPLVAGLVTGLAVGFVGTSFPIVLALAATVASGDAGLRPYIALAYAFGHLGQMLSPLHLCHIVSNRYFETGYAQVYRRIIPSVAITAVLAAAYFLFLSRLYGGG